MKEDDEIVDEFRLFRDQYYELHPKSSRADCLKDLKSRSSELVERLRGEAEISEEVESSSSSNASDTEVKKIKLNFAIGRILNVLPFWSQECEDCLSRTVKLDPNHTEGWNELGSCLWKKGDIEGAKRCFQTSDNKKQTSSSLSNLAMTIRQEAVKSVAEKHDNIRKSLNMAKQACTLDAEDSASLYMLGNAYLAYFFSCGQQEQDIQNAINAYSRAIISEKEKYNADLLFNYAQALRYEEEYSQSLMCLERTVKLDPHLSEAKDKLQNLSLYLSRIHDCILRKGKLKPKRLHSMINAMVPKKHLGPYAGGNFKSKNGKVVELKLCQLNELSAGRNPNVVVLGSVVGLVVNEETIPYTFAIIDSSGKECLCVTVYNFSGHFGVVIGDIVAIAEPYLVSVDVDVNGKKCGFGSLRVSSPEVLVINGKKSKKDNFAYTEISLSGPRWVDV